MIDKIGQMAEVTSPYLGYSAMMTISRRTFIKYAGGSTVSLAVSACMPRQSGNMMDTNTELLIVTPQSSQTASHMFEPDIDLTLRTALADVPIRAGKRTTVAQYTGKLHKGSADVMQSIPNSFLGPTLHFRRGDKVRITLDNRLDWGTIIHWHGQHVPEEMDGHPRFTIPPKSQYVYEFVVDNRAGTYWYHPHPHKQSGGQTYWGLAGMLIVHDDEEDQFSLPQGAFDIPLIIQDRTFDDDNQLRYIDNGHQVMIGFLAENVLVNGQLDYDHSVATRAYRLRLLNASNARTYKLAWDDGTPLTVIGTDGGLLRQPVERPYVMLGSAERVDLWVQFTESDMANGRRLISLPFEGGSIEQLDIMQFTVDRSEAEMLTLPDRFAPLAFHDTADAINQNNPRTFDFFVNHMTPTIDGLGFDLNGAREKEMVRLNTLEVWELTNDLNQGGFPHPIHVHGLQFQVIERTGTPADVADGYLDEGWKDTVLLMPGERVKILLKFEDFTGLFLYHCHNLEHEDGGMMRNYRVIA